MGAEEFDEEAMAVAEAVEGAELDERIAAACRGSGNPAALAWLAEGLRLGPGARVVDLGAGLCGPAAWLERHYRWRMVAADPAAGAVAGADRLFDVPVLRGAAAAAPVRDGSFDASLLLGVLSVVADPEGALREARRVAPRLGVLEWCSTGDVALAAGGSLFPTPTGLQAWVERTGWRTIHSVSFDAPVPLPWQAAAARGDVGTSDDEREVVDAIEARHLRMQLLVAAGAR